MALPVVPYPVDTYKPPWFTCPVFDSNVVLSKITVLFTKVNEVWDAVYVK